MATPLLEMKNITKEFPGVKALSNVSFSVMAGEIHCLVGENGAGKSTLMKVLSGVYPYGDYKGQILINGVEQHFRGIRDSEKAGIAIIYQELALFPELTVYENIFVGNENRKGIVMDWNETIKKANEMLAKVRLNVNPGEKIKNLGVGKQQLIEIAKALSKEVKLLILDEMGYFPLDRLAAQFLFQRLQARRYRWLGQMQPLGGLDHAHLTEGL